MSFKSIENHNPFIYISLLLLIILVIRKSLLRRPQFSLKIHKVGVYYTLLRLFVHRRLSQLLMSLLLVSVMLLCIFEYYYRVSECAVSSHYIDINIKLIQSVIELLTAAGISYWLDYATLLSQLRGQTINKWDHDVDVSILYPGLSNTLPNTHKSFYDKLVPPQGVASVDELFKVIQQSKLHFIWNESRHLIQLYQPGTTSGPHVDIWLWSPSVSTDERSVVLYTNEPGIEYNPRDINNIFPLQQVTWNGIGDNISIPYKSHVVSEYEFSPYGGDYMVAQVFRGDCFHNFFNARWMY